MPVWTIGGTKGGTGKSTLAVNLAAWLAARGRDVLLVDTDKQGSSALWWRLRVKGNAAPALTMIALEGDELHASIGMQAPKYSDVVIDAGGYDSVELRSALLATDLLITPARPGIFDFQALCILDRMVMDARAFNRSLDARLVLNMMPTHPKSTDAETMRESITALKIIRPLAAMIRSRRAFYDAAAEGLAVTETRSPDEKACAELNAVAMEVFQ